MLYHHSSSIFFFSSIRRHTRCALVTGVQTCALPIFTEATFGLPVFRHPPDSEEIAKLLTAQAQFPERAILVGVYALGKAQRVIALLRRAGYERPLFIHGALQGMCDLYRDFGVELGELRPATGAAKKALAGEIVLAPRSEEHTSELQSLMRISYAVFCLKKTKI